MKNQHSNQESQPVVEVVTITTDVDYEIESKIAFIQLATYTAQWRRQLAVSAQASVERSYQVALTETKESSTIHLLSESVNTLQVIRQEDDDRYMVTDFNLESGEVRYGSVSPGDDLDHALVTADQNADTLTTMIDTARIVYDCYQQEKRG